MRDAGYQRHPPQVQGGPGGAFLQVSLGGQAGRGGGGVGGGVGGGPGGAFLQVNLGGLVFHAHATATIAL